MRSAVHACVVSVSPVGLSLRRSFPVLKGRFDCEPSRFLDILLGSVGRFKTQLFASKFPNSDFADFHKQLVSKLFGGASS